MSIHPYNEYVLVQIIKNENKAMGPIYMPDVKDTYLQKAIVIKSDFPDIANNIWYIRNSGLSVNYNNVEYFLVPKQSVVAIEK